MNTVDLLHIKPWEALAGIECQYHYWGFLNKPCQKTLFPGGEPVDFNEQEPNAKYWIVPLRGDDELGVVIDVESAPIPLLACIYTRLIERDLPGCFSRGLRVEDYPPYLAVVRRIMDIVNFDDSADKVLGKSLYDLYKEVPDSPLIVTMCRQRFGATPTPNNLKSIRSLAAWARANIGVLAAVKLLGPEPLGNWNGRQQATVALAQVLLQRVVVRMDSICTFRPSARLTPVLRGEVAEGERARVARHVVTEAAALSIIKDLVGCDKAEVVNISTESLTKPTNNEDQTC